MKKFITIIYLAIGSLFTSVLSAQSLDTKADSAYTAGDYALATSLYEEAMKEQGTSASLLYNLGNSYYRQGKMAKAILSYERGLKLSPSDEALKSNLEFVNSKLIDKKGYEGSFLSRTFKDITNLMSANSWAWLSLILFAIAVGGAALYLFSSGILPRKIGFFGGLAVLMLFVVAIVFAINARRLMLASDAAIVSVPSSILSTSPRTPQNRNEEAMLLHEGAKVTILDSISSPTDSIKSMWYDVSFDNEHRAWINSKDVEVI